MTERSILLIEDNPDDRELTVRAIQRCSPKTHIFSAEDGAEALELLRRPGGLTTTLGKSQLSLILLDLKMPKVDGIDFLRRLREIPLASTVPIVVLTSSNERRDLIAAYTLGVNSYLTKPVEFDRFVEVMRFAIRYWLEFNELPVP